MQRTEPTRCQLFTSSNASKYPTHREQYEEDVLHNPLPTHTPNAHRTPPLLPIRTLIPRLNPPATKPLVQIKPPIALNTTTIPRLQIAQPVARNIDERRNPTRQDTRSDKDDPDLACVGELLDSPKKTRGAGV